MIHYQLRCTAGHEFDGWFKDSAGFERQAARRLLECPACGETSVSRALMAPALGRPRAAETAPVPAPPAPAAPEGAMAMSGRRLPAEVRAGLQRLRAEVEKNCDYVGSAFAEEARRVHNGETTRSRNIYGEATAEEADSLAEDGIGVSRIPWVPLADS